MSPEFRLRPSLSADLRMRGEADGVGVSPEFRLRPSLSVEIDAYTDRQVACVAGVQTPAFVERFGGAAGPSHAQDVSPEFRLRPSLSGRARRRALRPHVPVSPEFRLRPSLSERVRSFAGLPHDACRRSSDSGLR